MPHVLVSVGPLVYYQETCVPTCQGLRVVEFGMVNNDQTHYLTVVYEALRPGGGSQAVSGAISWLVVGSDSHHLSFLV